ncbi:MAG: hypothetical protein GY765_21765, partial [bacterium]|nr:hypothetical protein [bacterium]
KLEDFEDNSPLLLKCIAGSRAYGLHTPESDTDIKGIFVLPLKQFYGMDYIKQVNNESNDIVYYELERLFQLLSVNNPSILELLAMPEDCILYKHPLMDLLEPRLFLSRLCRNTFAGYAMAQVKRAGGLNKKIMNPLSKERLSGLDFCYVIQGQGSVLLTHWLKENHLRQENCGCVNIPHMKDLYAVFYDHHAREQGERNTPMDTPRMMENSTRGAGHPAHVMGHPAHVMGHPAHGMGHPPHVMGPPPHVMGHPTHVMGFRGILRKESANGIALSSIPKGLKPLGHMYYNREAYSKYCRDYKDYWDWVKKRNANRYRDTVAHGKNYDAKNMMHTFRLLDMAEEIAKTGQLVIRRSNREELLAIKKGEYMYDQLVEKAAARIEIIETLFETCPLPEEPDHGRLEELLVHIRKEFYRQAAGN